MSSIQLINLELELSSSLGALCLVAVLSLPILSLMVIKSLLKGRGVVVAELVNESSVFFILLLLLVSESP